MTTRIELAAELETIDKQNKVISRIVWSTAGLVMIFGIPIVYQFLTEHGVPGEIAWMLSVASDGALCVGLVGTPVLASYNIAAGWIGTLRWVAGFLTWGLQSAGSWFKPEGIDGVGVLAHSAGPVLLFFVVEGASYFQRKMGHVSTSKRLALEAMERKKVEEKSDLEALRRQLSTAESGRSEALRRVELVESQAASAASRRAAEEASAAERMATLEGQVRVAEEKSEALQDDLRRTVEALRKEHAEALRALRNKHREEPAEPSVIRLSDHRRPSGAVPPKTSGGASKASSGGRGGGLLEGRFSDEAAVQALLEYEGDLTKRWTQTEIVGLLRVGFSRAPRLVEAVTAEQLRRAPEGSSGAEATG